MYIITTTAQSGNKDIDYLEEFIQDSGFPYIKRKRQSLDELMRSHQADAIVVCYREGPVLFSGDDKFFFHPSMAKNRLAAYRKKGTADPFITACQLKPNDTLLDCTLGLGADAIVASYFTPEGRVVGVEASPAIALVVKWGMKLYSSSMQWLNEAIHRIEVFNCEHNAYLKSLDNDSFDIVYFDPMFRKPLLKSQAISPLRALANSEPLDKETIREACRVARKRVVIKELASGTELQRLGCDKLSGSKHNKIAYGIIEV